MTALAATVPVGTAVYLGKDGAPTFDATTSDGSDDDSLPAIQKICLRDQACPVSRRFRK